MELIREVGSQKTLHGRANPSAMRWGGGAQAAVAAPPALAVALQPQAQAAHTGCRYLRGAYAAGARNRLHKLSEADGLPQTAVGVSVQSRPVPAHCSRTGPAEAHNVSELTAPELLERGSSTATAISLSQNRAACMHVRRW